MSGVTLLGLAAAVLTTASLASPSPGGLVPQVVKAWRSGSSAALSAGMTASGDGEANLLFSTGVVLWLVYGVLIGDAPLIVANGITLALTASILVHFARSRRARP